MGAQLNTNPKFTFVFASTNKGKLAEVSHICSKLNWACIDPSSLVSKFGPTPDVKEGVESYRKNAYLKAFEFYQWCKMPCIADDTGLEVNLLSGLPGIKSARYAGDTATMQQNKIKLLTDMDSITDRSASFICVLCLVKESKLSYEQAIFAEATLKGRITSSPSGAGGFGYDDLFEVESHQPHTLAELKEQNFTDTHRSRSFSELNNKLSAHF